MFVHVIILMVRRCIHLVLIEAQLAAGSKAGMQSANEQLRGFGQSNNKEILTQ